MSSNDDKLTLPEGFADVSIKPIEGGLVAQLKEAGFTVTSSSTCDLPSKELSEAAVQTLIKYGFKLEVAEQGEHVLVPPEGVIISTMEQRGLSGLTPPHGDTSSIQPSISAHPAEEENAATAYHQEWIVESDNPQKRPPVFMEKITPEEMLKWFRKDINKGYMPSATGETEFNSKPEYLLGVNSWVQKKKNTVSPGWGIQFFKEIDRMFHSSKPDDPIWAFVEVKDITVGCNLKTDELYVAAVDGTWYPFKEPVAMDRLVLAGYSDFWIPSQWPDNLPAGW